jgi:hypothetical protein
MTAKHLICTALLLAAPLLHAAPNSGTPPVRELLPHENDTIAGLPQLTPVQLGLKVAAATAVRAFDKGAPRSAVQRRSGSDAAVYSGLPLTTAPLLPADTASSQPNFQVDKDWGQAWATMTAAGVPHLMAIGYGDFDAEATASWHATVVIPSDGAREVFIRVALPAARVAGDTEVNGPHRWQSRLSADLLVNGWPAWSTEAVRISRECTLFTMPPHLCNEKVNDNVLIQSGKPLQFPTDDEDTSTANDSTDKDDMVLHSQRRLVSLSLGRHGPGTRLHLAWMLRGRAWTEPMQTGGTDHRCKKNYQLDAWFCSRAEVSITGAANDAPEVRFGP